MLFFSKRLQYIWHCVPGYPDANIQFCAGCVNNSYFDHSFGNYKPETLLFWGATKEPIADDINPARLYTITYEFLWRPDTWNKIYSGITNKFEPIVLASDGATQPYLPRYFPILFRLSDETTP